MEIFEAMYLSFVSSMIPPAVIPQECSENDFSSMADQNLRVVFYIPTRKHSENNSDNRNETWKQERAGKNFLAATE